MRAGSIPSGAHRNLCAPLGSGSSQLEHLDLEPVPVEKAEMRRRSSRRSHHLHSKRAHDRGFREPNAAARSIGARWAVTSAVRGEGAHVLEQFRHVLGWHPSRPSRSSAAGLVAPDRTFRAAETPGGSHSGSQPNAAPATAPVRSPRHPRMAWLHAATSPGALPHAQACPPCSNSISPRGCRTLRFWRPWRA